VAADQAVESEALARRRRAVLMVRITASVYLATANRLADGGIAGRGAGGGSGGGG
jgi:hypothetical protein